MRIGKDWEKDLEDLEEFEDEELEDEEKTSKKRKSWKLEVRIEAVSKDILRRPRWLLVLSVLKEPMRVADIVDETGLPRSTISRILHKLSKYDLVEAYRGIDSRSIYYKLSKDGKKVVEDIGYSVRKKLRKCLVDEKELDLKCVINTLGKINKDKKVISALLSISDVEIKGDKLVMW